MQTVNINIYLLRNYLDSILTSQSSITLTKVSTFFSSDSLKFMHYFKCLNDES